MPFHAVPVIFWDGEMLAQTQAIARFVARKTGLAGSNDVEFAHADMIACHCEDLIAKWVWGRFPPSDEARIQNSQELLETVLPKWLEQAEALLKKRDGVWFAGNGLTFGDVAVMNILTFMMHPKEAIWKDMNNEAARASLLDSFLATEQTGIYRTVNKATTTNKQHTTNLKQPDFIASLQGCDGALNQCNLHKVTIYRDIYTHQTL